MEFGDKIDKFTILKMPFSDYKGKQKRLLKEFRIVGVEHREKIREEEIQLLQRYFKFWHIPIRNNILGWRDDSPIYVLYRDKLVGGAYSCDKTIFGVENYGSFNYIFVAPEFQRQGIFTRLLAEGIKKGKQWGLDGYMLATNRYGLPEVYLGWGATIYKKEA